MIAVIDNYDSFTYNLVQYLGELGAQVEVYRNDMVTLHDLERADPSHVVISPGPGDPSEAGISNDVIQHRGKVTPILGVCLGQQCIGLPQWRPALLRTPQPISGRALPLAHRGRAVARLFGSHRLYA
jgi:anthranilate synthase/aminodeoxychorismate synthase-like glutamine amidotransferase